MATYIEPRLPSLLSQQGYDVDARHRQLYGGGCLPSPSGQPLLISPMTHGQHINPSIHMMHQGAYGHALGSGFVMSPQGIYHTSGAGDLHTGSFPADLDTFSHSRPRPTTLTGFPVGPNGHYTLSGMALNQRMEYPFCNGTMFETCSYCRAKHPIPHPLVPIAGHNQLAPMLPRPMGLDDPLLTQSIGYRNSARHQEEMQMPMFDPFDAPWNANFQRGRGELDNRSSRRSSSIGPRRLPGLPGSAFDELRIAEISDSDDEDAIGRSRNGRRSTVSRRGSIGNLSARGRSHSRGRMFT